MSTTAVQDEYNAFFPSDQPRHTRHPSDSNSGLSDGDMDGTTLASSTNKLSIRSATKKTSGRTLGAHSSTTYDSRRGDSSDEDESAGEEERARRPTQYYLPRSYNSYANTGPKGVIADAQAFEAQKRVGRSAQGNAHFQRTHNMVLPKAQRAVQHRSSPSRRSSSHSSVELDADDDDALAAWRASRIAELKKSQAAQGLRSASASSNEDTGTAGRGPPLRASVSSSSTSRVVGLQTPLVYCGLERVDEMGYLEAVERAGRGAVVAVLIFDDGERPSSNRRRKAHHHHHDADDDDYDSAHRAGLSETYAAHLARVAAKYPGTRFVALHAAVAEIAAAGVPALLAYRNGDLFADFLPLAEEVPCTCNVVTNLEDALLDKGIVSG